MRALLTGLLALLLAACASTEAEPQVEFVPIALEGLSGLSGGALLKASRRELKSFHVNGYRSADLEDRLVSSRQAARSSRTMRTMTF